jgi:predicted MFS family arabinose efflux permease
MASAAAAAAPSKAPSLVPGRSVYISYWLPKLLYFTCFAAQGSLLSFLPVFYRDTKHLTLHMVGIIGLLSPAVKFVAAPALSGLADSLRCHRLLMLLAILFSTGLRFLLLVVSSVPALVLVIVVAESIGAVIVPIFENGVLQLLGVRPSPLSPK